MKTIKLLPLIIALPLLAGCGKDLKAPKFAKEGDKVEYAAWFEALDKTYGENAFFKSEENYMLPSYKATVKSGTFDSIELTRDKKVVRFEHSLSNGTISMQADANNKILQGKSILTYSVEAKDGGENTKSKGKDSEESYMQKISDDGKDYFADVDINNHAYKLTAEITEANPLDVVFNTQIRMMTLSGLSPYMTFMSRYSLASDEEKAKYSFYKNGNIFTAEYKDEQKDVEVKDGEDKVRYVVNSTSLNKIQIDLSKNDSFKVVSYIENKQENNYKQNEDYCYEGDIEAQVGKSSLVAEFALKDVKLKAADVSKYSKVE